MGCYNWKQKIHCNNCHIILYNYILKCSNCKLYYCTLCIYFNWLYSITKKYSIYCKKCSIRYSKKYITQLVISKQNINKQIKMLSQNIL